jgi:hypothetical protein
LEAKRTCTKTFIIEKTFTVLAESNDPTNPGRRNMKVKRVAELKAVSLMHALNMIGWDKRNVTLVNVRDDYDGKVDVQVNGKFIGRVDIPSSKAKFEELSGGQQNAERRNIQNSVVSTDLVKKYFHDNNMSEVKKIIYVPYRLVNVVAKRELKHKACTCEEHCGEHCECVKVG